MKIVIFRTMQESFNNIAKYSESRHVELTLLKREESIELTIQDDGVGFDTDTILCADNGASGHGLASMKERVELANGAFSIGSIIGRGHEDTGILAFCRPVIIIFVCVRRRGVSQSPRDLTSRRPGHCPRSDELEKASFTARTTPSHFRGPPARMNPLAAFHQRQDPMDKDPPLVPILREGIDVVKILLFKRLKARLPQKHPALDARSQARLAGALLNELFGNQNTDEPFATFAAANKSLIDGELACLADECADLRIPLTDALRIQFLCDAQEGIDSSHVLHRANELHILIPDREAPLPARFVSLVRRLGTASELLTPMPKTRPAPH